MSNRIWRFLALREEVSLKWFACGKQLFLDTGDISRWEELWKRAIISMTITRHTGRGYVHVRIWEPDKHFGGLRLRFSDVGISGNEDDADKNLNELFSRLYANIMFSVCVEVVKAVGSCCVLQRLQIICTTVSRDEEETVCLQTSDICVTV